MGNSSLRKPHGLDYQAHADRLEFRFHRRGRAWYFAALAVGCAASAAFAFQGPPSSCVGGNCSTDWAVAAWMMALLAVVLAALALACRRWYSVVIVTPRGIWKKSPLGRERRLGLPKQLSVRQVNNGRFQTYELRTQGRARLRSTPSRIEALFMEQEIENFLGIVDVPVEGAVFRPGALEARYSRRRWWQSRRQRVEGWEPPVVEQRNTLPIIGRDVVD